jgi:hypothetical protein
VQVHHALAEQLLLQLPAVRVAVGVPVPLPRLQEYLKALVDTFCVQPPLPFLDEPLVSTLVLVAIAAAERSRLPEVAVLAESQKMEDFLGALGLSPKLFSCLVDALILT